MRGPRGARRAIGFALLTLVVSGCHTYRPIADPAPGMIVRVHVPVTSAVQDRNAPTPTVPVEGSVLEGGETLVRATETRRELGAFREVIQFDTLRLSPSQRSSVELREFSSGRSVVLGVVIAGGAALLATTAFGIAGGSDGMEGPGTNPPNPAIVISGSVIGAIWGAIAR